jgi:2-dehydropantoate 2-reductase
VRFVVYGAGAIGGLVGAALHASGHDVALITRGPHLEAIRDRGLRVEHPEGAEVVSIPVSGHPSEVPMGPQDVVLLTMKSQDTAQALADLSTCADPSVAVVCVQNGVENERQALRRFERTHSVSVVCPAAHLEPGTVRAYSSPTIGILDLGRYPSGADQLTHAVSAAFHAAGFSSQVRTDIMRWKYRKLLSNLTNAIEAICGPGTRSGPLADMVTREGERCLHAAGIEFASAEEDARQRADLLHLRPMAGEARPGGSTWQSLRRGTGSIETDYLNGEIVLLGRLHGVATPANETAQALANEMARNGEPPGSISTHDLLARINDRSAPSAQG